MFVCVCNPVSDKAIVQAARDGACCMRDLRERLGVGARCGKCVPMAKALLHQNAPGARQVSRLRDAAGLAAAARPATVSALAA